MLHLLRYQDIYRTFEQSFCRQKFNPWLFVRDNHVLKENQVLFTLSHRIKYPSAFWYVISGLIRLNQKISFILLAFIKSISWKFLKENCCFFWFRPWQYLNIQIRDQKLTNEIPFYCFYYTIYEVLICHPGWQKCWK